MYAKIINEKTLQEAPKEFIIGARRYIGFTNSFLLEQGYKPVDFVELDQNEINADDTYESYYTESEYTITQKWRKVPKVSGEEPS